MVKYEYDVESEVFKRVDNRGRHLYVNITEAQRIISLMNLGMNKTKIQSKVTLSHPMGTSSTIETFIKNYKNGNIIIPENAPAPKNIFDEFVEESRMDKLEERVKNLENLMAEIKSDCFCSSFATESPKMEKGIVERIRSWV